MIKTKLRLIQGGGTSKPKSIIEESTKEALEEFSEQIQYLNHAQLAEICKSLFVRNIALLCVTAEEDPEKIEIINELTKIVCQNVFEDKKALLKLL